MTTELLYRPTESLSGDDEFLMKIQELDTAIADHFSDRLIIDEVLTRKIVSFQANKTRTCYRWYKYKEAFSANLVEYLFKKYRVNKGKILDPFSGAGTALFACSDLEALTKRPASAQARASKAVAGAAARRQQSVLLGPLRL